MVESIRMAGSFRRRHETRPTLFGPGHRVEVGPIRRNSVCLAVSQLYPSARVHHSCFSQVCCRFGKMWAPGTVMEALRNYAGDSVRSVLYDTGEVEDNVFLDDIRDLS